SSSAASPAAPHADTTEGGGADPEPVGAAGVSAKTSRSNSTGGEPDSPSWSRASLGVFQTRSIFHLPRRSSSGYFSADGSDSVPSSPLSPKRLTADKTTQTPSPSGQVIRHALERMAGEAHRGGPETQRQQHGELNDCRSCGQRKTSLTFSAVVFALAIVCPCLLSFLFTVCFRFCNKRVK
uniref:Uncharacterized protein n=1 Tax=Acanthochromis polyacanthus TaxID=80966 RepID=A0A3Q1ELG4_9TELE